MHRFKQIEYKAGITVEVIKCMPRGCRRGEVRGPAKIKKSREEMVEANMRQAARKLTRKINANFKPGDWHITLTYRKSQFDLKYIYVTEYENKSIHHHFIVNNVNDGKKTTTDYVRELWRDKGNPKFVPLYDNGEYKVLADYFIKETEKTFRKADSPVRQRYACSRNLINPKPQSRIRKTKGMWKMDPKPRPGYYIDKDTLYNGTDKLGYPYQRYVMIKLNPTDADWESCSGFPSD